MKFNKKIVVVLSLAILMTSSLTFANIDIKGYISDITLLLNGEKVDKEIVMIDGSSYLPVRAISEALNLNVEWEGSTNTIKLDKKKEVDKDAFDKEMLGIMEDNNKTLKSENDKLKDLLLKNSIKIPTEDAVVKYLNDEGMGVISSIMDTNIYPYFAFDFNDGPIDTQGKRYRNYVGFSTRENGGSDKASVTYAPQGQFDFFKATLAVSDKYKNDNISRDVVVYADDKEVLRRKFTQNTLPEDIVVNIKGAKIVTLKLDQHKDIISYGGIIFAEPRFTTN